MTTPWPYVPARYQYGPRKTTLGLVFHCAEASSGVVGYLSRDPARGVSANFVCENDGRMVRMMGLGIASGSLNPADRSSDKPYYGHSHLVDVLGNWWTNPNAAVISVEIECYAKTGPNQRQVAALIEWAGEMVKLYPGIRGALGHADQTDTKPCPGTTTAMKSIFDAIGGHGLWVPQEEPVGPEVRNLTSFTGTATIKGDGHGAILANDGSVVFLPNGATKEVVAKANLVEKWPDHDDTTVYLVGSEPAYLLAEDVTIVAAPPVNCTDKIAAQREKDRAASLAAIEGVFSA